MNNLRFTVLLQVHITLLPATIIHIYPLFCLRLEGLDSMVLSRKVCMFVLGELFIYSNFWRVKLWVSLRNTKNDSDAIEHSWE